MSGGRTAQEKVRLAQSTPFVRRGFQSDGATSRDGPRTSPPPSTCVAHSHRAAAPRALRCHVLDFSYQRGGLRAFPPRPGAAFARPALLDYTKICLPMATLERAAQRAAIHFLARTAEACVRCGEWLCACYLFLAHCHLGKGRSDTRLQINQFLVHYRYRLHTALALIGVFLLAHHCGGLPPNNGDHD